MTGFIGSIGTGAGTSARDRVARGEQAQLSVAIVGGGATGVDLGWRRALARTVSDWLSRVTQPTLKLH